MLILIRRWSRQGSLLTCKTGPEEVDGSSEGGSDDVDGDHEDGRGRERDVSRMVTGFGLRKLDVSADVGTGVDRGGASEVAGLLNSSEMKAQVVTSGGEGV